MEVGRCGLPCKATGLERVWGFQMIRPGPATVSLVQYSPLDTGCRLRSLASIGSRYSRCPAFSPVEMCVPVLATPPPVIDGN